MDFFPYHPFDRNEAQEKLWNWIKKAFSQDEGVAYYRYPIFTQAGRLYKEPDIIVLHREYGLWVFECKGCQIHNIESIQGHEWQMLDWYDERITPLQQAEDQMFALKNRLNRRETRNLIAIEFRVALPLITREEWTASGWSELPSIGGAVLVYDDLTPNALREYLKVHSDSRNLSDEEWEMIKRVLGGTLPNRAPRAIPTGSPLDSPLRVIREIDQELKSLDDTQKKIAFEVPEGPQRLRGLAGTGKTILLAKRAVKIHIKHPEWRIGFVFFTRSLYDQITDLIGSYHRELHPDNIDPNYHNLQILHAWGARNRQGFYRKLAQRSGNRPKSVYDVKNEIGRSSPAESFEYVCNSLEDDIDEVPELYDVILIDEGQDLPYSFYRLAYQSLSDPKRLYWAYDEAQGIGSLLVPEASSVFGRNEQGNLIVDLRGNYEGGISKGHRMNRCYRTPRFLLMVAHAINMGLFRKNGPLQGVTRQKQWAELGYHIEGSFNQVGTEIEVTRPARYCPHPVDQPDFMHKQSASDLLVAESFDSIEDEQVWIANHIKQDLERGFTANDILITSISGDNESVYFTRLSERLKERGISPYIAGSTDHFSIDNHVTISNIFRAKGNEAWRVYICRFDYVNRPLEWRREEELHKRNEAFVALTRSRLWNIITGLHNPEVFEELSKAIEQYPTFRFPAFNKSSLKRDHSLDDQDAGQLSLFQSGNELTKRHS